MRIGLYGMPTAGKSYILERIEFLEVLSGSSLLQKYDLKFLKRTEAEQEIERRALAQRLKVKKNFIMDGHYAFGDKIVFTEDDGQLYDVFLYVYVDPRQLTQRMKNSAKNKKYLEYDVEAWQRREIEGLRNYCHKHMKDFYVLDNPPDNCWAEVQEIIDFIRDVNGGYSCLRFAEKCAEKILCRVDKDIICLFDGDKTLSYEDCSAKILGYSTKIFNGNFYTGFQAWKQNREFMNFTSPKLVTMPVKLNDKVVSQLTDYSILLTSGHRDIWRFIANKLGIDYYCDAQMSAETKLFITKLLQKAGKCVVAYGDSMNDYFMLKQADIGYLISKPDGTISRSLAHRDIGGLRIVRIEEK